MAKIDVRGVGDYIREQRSAAEISLRQLAKTAGVSNPYLSQIERGLRKPSAEILQQIAKALRISAEALYVQAGILEERYGDSDVPAAVLGDGHLDERQKAVLLELYEAYRRENADAQAASSDDAATTTSAASAPAPKPATPPRPAAATSGSATRTNGTPRAKTSGTSATSPKTAAPRRRPRSATPPAASASDAATGAPGHSDHSGHSVT